MVECGGRLERLPSLTGLDAARLAGLLGPLESREAVRRRVLEALEEMEASPEPVVLFLVAEWGEGKTSVFNTVVAPEARSRGWAVAEARAASVLAYLQGFRESGGQRSPAYQFLAAVLAAALEAAGSEPPAEGAPRKVVVEALERLAPRGERLLVFVDEMEDLVTSRDEGLVGAVVAGIVGLVNGEVAEARCSGGCSGARVHLVVSLTPPAYARLSAVKDFATIAARLKRRVRIVRVPPLPRWEAHRFLETLTAYSLGGGLGLLFENPRYSNSVVAVSLGNMGALVSAFRFLAARALARGRERGCRGNSVERLSARGVVEELSALTLSIGGAELPALNSEVLERLVVSLSARSGFAGYPREAGERLALSLVAGLAAPLEELAGETGLEADGLEELLEELSAFAEESWLKRELGAQSLVYRVYIVDDVDGVVRDVLGAAGELAGVRDADRIVAAIAESMVYRWSDGRLVAAIPVGQEELAGLVADASPIDVPRGLAERIAGLLWRRLAPRTEASRGRGVVLSPRIAKALFLSPELRILDFVVDRAERLRLNRRAWGEGGPGHLLAGAIAALAARGLLVAPPTPQGEGSARAVVELPGLRGARVRLLVYACRAATLEEASRLEAVVTAAVLSGWRPHAVLLLCPSSQWEPGVAERLHGVEKRFFLRVVAAPIDSLVARVQLTVLGLRLGDAAGSPEEALRLAYEAAVSQERAEELGLDPHRLHAVLREVYEQLEVDKRLRRALEEGVDGAPLVVRDPQLGYDVEKPTELAGALRYYLVVPSVKATPREALRAAHELVLRYHIYRHGGGERGLLSPDIDRREVGTLERYTLLLAANGFLEKTNGEVRIDVLSPGERSVLEALRQLGARGEPVQASQVWDLLVVAAQNPGTRRMLLQSLAYRGLVELSGRRVDPEKTRVRLTDTPSDAERGLAEAFERLRRIEESPLLAWGALVSCKARDCRAGTLRGLVEKTRAMLRLAREALETGNTLIALRLSRLLRDLMAYAEEELLGDLVAQAAGEARRIREVLEGTLGELEEAKNAAEDMAKRLLGQHVELEVIGLRVLRGALEKLEEVWGLDLGEEELELEISKMMREAQQRAPREPGRLTPFYIGGRGPQLYYNYKLWLLVDALGRLGALDYEPGSPRPSARIREELAELEELAEKLRQGLEEASELRRLAARLEEAAARAGLEGMRIEATLPRLPLSTAKTYRVGEALRAVEEWLAELRAAKRPLEDILERIARLTEQRRRAAEASRSLETLIARALDAERALREAGLLHLAARLEEAISDAKLALEQASKLLAPTGETGSDPVRVVGEAIERTLSANAIVRDAASRLERELREAIAGLEEEYRRLTVEAEALAKIAGVKLEIPGDPVKGAAALRKTIAALWEQAVKTRAVDEETLKVYLVVVEEKASRGEMLLSEAAKQVSARLGIEPSEARRTIIKLIEMGLLEPRI